MLERFEQIWQARIDRLDDLVTNPNLGEQMPAVEIGEILIH
jgi:hypothetical protein